MDFSKGESLQEPIKSVYIQYRRGYYFKIDLNDVNSSFKEERRTKSKNMPAYHKLLDSRMMKTQQTPVMKELHLFDNDTVVQRQIMNPVMRYSTSYEVHQCCICFCIFRG